jgi:hypothetical protein
MIPAPRNIARSLLRPFPGSLHIFLEPISDANLLSETRCSSQFAAPVRMPTGFRRDLLGGRGAAGQSGCACLRERNPPTAGADAKQSIALLVESVNRGFGRPKCHGILSASRRRLASCASMSGRTEGKYRTALERGAPSRVIHATGASRNNYRPCVSPELFLCAPRQPRMQDCGLGKSRSRSSGA